MADDSPLHILGRRAERLFFTGLILITLSFWDLYLTTANLQFSQDRSLTAIEIVLSEMQPKLSHYETLFDTKPEPRAEPIDPRLLDKEAKRIAATRKKLGLPPAKPPAPATQPPKVPTYADELSQIFETAATKSGVPREDLNQFQDATIKPAELIKKLRAAKASIESQPTSVWGIQTPRLVKVGYIGLDYEFPYAFLATVITVISAPLIFAWLRLLYITRQREIIEIMRATDFKLVFPHILNFLPVRFQEKGKPPDPKVVAGESIGRVLLVLTRVVVILAFVSPIFYSHCSSLIQLWRSANSDISWIVYLAIVFTFFSALLSIALIAQECGLLATKQFIEER